MALVVLPMGLAGCGPAVVWHGHTPDRERMISVLSSPGAEYVMVGDSAGARYDAVAPLSVAISRDGERIAYAARNGRAWLVVSPDGAYGRWDAVGSITFAPDGRSVIYTARRGDHWHVGRNAEVGPGFDAILDGTLVVSAGGRVAYAARQGDSIHVWNEGELSPGWDGVAALRSDATGRDVAYIGRRGEAMHLVSARRTYGPHEAIADYAWLANGGLAFLARRGGAWYAVIGSRSLGPYRGAGALRAAGEHWAFLARTDAGDRVVRDAGEGPIHEAIVPASLILHPRTGATACVVIDGASRRAVAAGVLGPAVREIRELSFSADGSRFAYVAADSDGQHVMLDHTRMATHEYVGDLQFDRDNTPAFIARDATATHVNVRGEAHAFDIVVDRTLVLDSATGGWAVLVGDRASRRLEIIVDGTRTGRAFDWRELTGEVLRGGDRSVSWSDESVRDWLRAEIRLHRGTAREP